MSNQSIYELNSSYIIILYSEHNILFINHPFDVGCKGSVNLNSVPTNSSGTNFHNNEGGDVSIDRQNGMTALW